MPLILEETTPPPAEPASSPVLILRLEPARAAGLPSTLTFWLPSARSESIATLTYGIGTGPAGEGVLQTSGTEQTWVKPSP